MVFISNGFLKAYESFSHTPTNIVDMDMVSLSGAIYDELFVSSEVDSDYSTSIPSEWDYSTIIHALFNGNLSGGNMEFYVDQVSSLRIKRREAGAFDWITLFDVPINAPDDFQFTRLDKYARANTEYEYGMVPVVNDMEGEIIYASILSDFDGVFISEKDITYGTILDVEISAQKNRESSTIVTHGRKYPYVISNGYSDYYSGSISGSFIEQDQLTKMYDVENGVNYRRRLDAFLNNGRPKVIKTYDGRMWIAKCTGAPSQDDSRYIYAPITRFSFTEIADAESSHDLYINGFIDCDIEGDV